MLGKLFSALVELMEMAHIRERERETGTGQHLAQLPDQRDR